MNATDKWRKLNQQCWAVHDRLVSEKGLKATQIFNHPDWQKAEREAHQAYLEMQKEENGK